jgi:hypothetical protein
MAVKVSGAAPSGKFAVATEYLQGVLPGGARGGEVTGRGMGVAEVGAHHRLPVLLADRAVDGQGAPEVGDGLAVTAQVVSGVAEECSVFASPCEARICRYRSMPSTQ